MYGLADSSSQSSPGMHVGGWAPVDRRRLEGAQLLLADGREHERRGRFADALQAYRAAVETAEREGALVQLAEALRRLAAIHRRRHEEGEAIKLCRQSYEVANGLGDKALAAEAMNGIALAHVSRGELEKARDCLNRALELGSEVSDLRGRIEQNLGITSNIQGDIRSALRHYQRSLQAFREARNEHGCAIAYHNLGMISADQERWEDAENFFRMSLDIVNATGDIHLRGGVLLNWTEVHLARGHYEDARRSAEEALQIFDRVGSPGGKAGAYKFLGVLFRETGRPVLAEARLKASLELASEVGAALDEAEASRELALLYQTLGRNQDALRLLNSSHRLFGRLDARADLVDVAGKVEQLESLYLAVVSDWGRSIESSDSYTHGHSERVAGYALRLAEMLDLDAGEKTTVRIGAYLHDLGKVRVPHEILNKPGRLTVEEFEIMKQHPVYGIELLASVEFPWDIKPIIRWHHEKIDGSGYPDRLAGDEIPLSAQIICMADVYDALTSTRSYRAAMSPAEAMAEIERCRQWWRPDVYEGWLTAAAR